MVAHSGMLLDANGCLEIFDATVITGVCSLDVWSNKLPVLNTQAIGGAEG